MYLLDTNVVSELRKAKSGKANGGVVEWARGVSATDMYLSVITILELETGVLRISRRDPVQAKRLATWLEKNVLPAFSGRILPVDIAIARRCAQLHVPDSRSDRDSLIAATALTHSMTVVTRNISDFEPTGVESINPWS